MRALELADRHGGEMQILVTHAFDPGDNRAMWTGSA